MKKRIRTIVSLALTLLFVAGVSYATFSQPNSAAPNNNAFGYIDVGGTPGGADAGVKQGGLGVNKFFANNNALFKDQVYFDNPIQGQSNDPTSINFGDSAHTVGVSINQNIKGSALQSNTVKSTKSGYDYLCSDADGKLVLCGKTGTQGYDLCTNLGPSQDSNGTKVPDGYVRNTDGTCTPINSGNPNPPPADMCSNMSGTQTTVPTGYTQQGTGASAVCLPTLTKLVITPETQVFGTYYPGDCQVELSAPAIDSATVKFKTKGVIFGYCPGVTVPAGQQKADDTQNSSKEVDGGTCVMMPYPTSIIVPSDMKC